jgi:predicted anti-sigma-YlaC factor YlaD
MSCSEHQLMISKLLDGEVLPGASEGTFGHLASCGECRGFYHQLQALNSSLDRIAEPLPEKGAMELWLPGVLTPGKPQPWWNRQVQLRLPVLGLLLCALAAAIFFSFSRGFSLREPETVYVTKIPAVIITADVPSSNLKQ